MRHPVSYLAAVRALTPEYMVRPFDMHRQGWKQRQPCESLPKDDQFCAVWLRFSKLVFNALNINSKVQLFTLRNRVTVGDCRFKFIKRIVEFSAFGIDYIPVAESDNVAAFGGNINSCVPFFGFKLRPSFNLINAFSSNFIPCRCLGNCSTRQFNRFFQRLWF